MKISKVILLSTLFLLSCSNNDDSQDQNQLQFEKVSVGDHRLEMLSRGEGNHTIILESGLDATVQNKWLNTGILSELSKNYQVIAYHRAGYGNSDRGQLPRTLTQSSDDLKSLISNKSLNSKVILVGHSWGSSIARTLAVRFPEKVEGIVLLDPWHENYFTLTQWFIDQYLQQSHQLGAKDEIENGFEIIDFLRQMGNIPDIPTTVLTATNTDDYGQSKFNVHESLGQEISSSNFVHELVNTGHDIPAESPTTVTQKIVELINRM